MVNAQEVIDLAMKLNGYTDRDGNPDTEQYASAYKSSLAFVNVIMTDLARVENKTLDSLTSVDDEIGLSQAAIDDIMPYGVAWLIAQSVNDGAKEALYGAMYQQKRPTAPQVKKYVTNMYTMR